MCTFGSGDTRCSHSVCGATVNRLIVSFVSCSHRLLFQFWTEDSPILVYVYSHWIHRRGSKYIAIMYYCHKLRRLFSLCAVTLCMLSVSSVISTCICFCFVLFFLMPFATAEQCWLFKKEVKNLTAQAFQPVCGMSDVSTKLIACNNENNV